MRPAVGDWIMPWPGEMVMGEVVAFAMSGDGYVCRTSDGQRFEVSAQCIVDAGQVMPADFVAGLLTHTVGQTTVAANARPEAAIKRHLRLVR